MCNGQHRGGILAHKQVFTNCVITIFLSTGANFFPEKDHCTPWVVKNIVEMNICRIYQISSILVFEVEQETT